MAAGDKHIYIKKNKQKKNKQKKKQTKKNQKKPGGLRRAHKI